MRRYIAILLCMAVAVGAVACQPTPEQAVVVKKDTERMIEQAAQPSNGAMKWVFPKGDTLFLPRD